MKFAVVDLSNLFHRSRHGAMGDTETKVGMALLIVFRSLRKLYRALKIDHIVFAVDQSSWRNAIYPAYKSRRRAERALATPAEQRESESFFVALNSLTEFLDVATRCTVLRAADLEGDDLVAGWIIRHPTDEHIIISGDSDFVQLLAANVKIYDAINQRTLGIDQITDAEDNRLEFSVSPKDGKIKVGKPVQDFVPENDWWRKALFIKLVRGDVGDSVFSSFPGVRYEGKKVGIRTAWEDRITQGYDWNNFMFQSWSKLIDTLPNGEILTETVQVINEFHRNEILIDLTKQPDWVKARIGKVIDEAIDRCPPANIGAHFLRFCTKHDLPSLAKEANDHVAYLNQMYQRTS